MKLEDEHLKILRMRVDGERFAVDQLKKALETAEAPEVKYRLSLADRSVDDAMSFLRSPSASLVETALEVAALHRTYVEEVLKKFGTSLEERPR